MAVILAFRLAILLAPPAAASLRYVQGPGTATLDRFIPEFWDRLNDPDESDEDLSLAMSERVGDTILVTTFAEPFEVRRIQLAWSIGSASLLDEDVRVCTFHLLKAPSGVPTATWDSADFTAMKNAIYAFWTTMKITYRSELSLQSIKAYREGPDITPPQPPVFSETPTPITGSASGTLRLPPQCAISVTEKTDIRRSWGRIYLPAPAANYTDGTAQTTIDGVGRVPDNHCSKVADAAVVMYIAWKTANLIPVVYRKPLPARFSSEALEHGDEEPDIPARAGSCLTINTLQVDNIYDVIRSRRFDKPSLRVLRNIP